MNVRARGEVKLTYQLFWPHARRSLQRPIELINLGLSDRAQEADCSVTNDSDKEINRLIG